jgi:integrase
MALLRWNDISKDSIDYVRSKTGKQMTISITKTTRQLLNYFRTMKYGGPTSYVFPILSKEYGDTPKEQKAKYNRIGDKRSDYNDDLRKLAKRAKIDINITSYVARHSFAFNAFTNDVGKQYIGQALGHSLEKQTNKYIGKLDHKKIANKIEQALT